MGVIAALSIFMAASEIILNSVILIVYFRDRCKGKALTACEQILFSMAFTSIAIGCSVIADNLVFHLKPCNVQCEEAYLYVNINHIILLSFVDASFWQTALLSTYYCVKLINISHYFFRWVNQLISSSTTLLLLGSAVFSFLINISFFWGIHLDGPGNMTQPAEMMTYIWDLSSSYYVFNMMLGCCLPFLFSFTCIALSVRSLLRHVCRIRKNILHSGSSSVIGGPVQAVSTMVMCAMLDLVYCVDFVGQVLSMFNNGDVVDTIAWVIFLLYPIMRPIIIIIRNPPLKRRLGEMGFSFLKC